MAFYCEILIQENNSSYDLTNKKTDKIKQHSTRNVKGKKIR